MRSPKQKQSTMSDEPKHHEMEHWQVIEEREVFALEPWMRISTQDIRLPDGRVVHNFGRIQLPDYVIIFAQTSNGRVIVERQYKHGVGSVSLMFPSGMIEPGEQPLQAAQRELLEETGYHASQWQALGSFVSNGNYGCGTAHVFKVKGVQRVAEPDSGDLEEMEILLKTPQELFEAVLSGEVGLLGSATAVALATNPMLSDRPINGQAAATEGQTAD